MAETKKTLLRFGGKTLAGLIRHVARTSKIINEPADLVDRLIRPILASWHAGTASS